MPDHPADPQTGGGAAATPADRVGRGPVWYAQPPTKAGLYWHWNGDDDCAPFPLFVNVHGDGKSFVMYGQGGLNRAIECDEYGGWWMPLLNPPTWSDDGATFNLKDSPP